MRFNQCCHRRRQQHYFCKCAARFAACRSFFSFAVAASLASGIQASNLTYIAACLYQETYFSMRFFGQFSMGFIIFLFVYATLAQKQALLTYRTYP